MPLFFADPEFKRAISSVVDREKSVKARLKRRTLHEPNLIPIKVDPNNKVRQLIQTSNLTEVELKAKVRKIDFRGQRLLFFLNKIKNGGKR